MKRAMVGLVMLVIAASVSAQGEAPASYDELITAAHEHVQAREFDRAEAVLANALDAARTDEERAAAIFALASSHETRGDREGAAGVLQRALELEGGGDWLVRCLERLGALADRLRDADAARLAWQRLLEVLGPEAPQAAGLRMQLASLALEAGELERAAEHLREVLASDAHEAWHGQARAHLAEVQLGRQQYQEALATAAGMDDAARRRRIEMEIAQRLLDAGEVERGADVARGVLDETPEFAPAMRLVYEAATAQGTVDELRDTLRAEADGDDPEAALVFLREIARWEGDLAAALKHLTRLARLRPEDADLRVDLGGAAVNARRLDEAEAALREALRIAPQHRGALTTLAEVLVLRGKTDEAIGLLKRAVNYDPADPATVRSLDYALRRHSLHHERARAIQQAREATGDESLMAYELAQAQIDLLRYDRAAQELLIALSDDGTPARAVGMQLEQLVADDIAGEDVLAAVVAYADRAEDLSDAARLALARVFLAADERERATSLLEGVEGAGAAVADLAREAKSRGDDNLAASLYAMALGMTGTPQERAEITLSLARLRRDAGDWRDALDTLAGAPALDSHPEALLMQAELLTEHAHDLDEAREAWESVLARAGGDPHYAAAAREGMADWLFASGRLDEAEQAYAEIAGGDEGGAPGSPWDDLPPLPPGLLLPGGVALPTQVAGDDSARSGLVVGGVLPQVRVGGALGGGRGGCG